MRFLILVSFLITPALCGNPISMVKDCVFGDSDPVCKTARGCNTPDKCPKTCNHCPYQKNFNKLEFKKVDCLKDMHVNGQSPAGCWLIDFKNENGKEIVYFYAQDGGVVYKGIIQSHPGTEIVAVGDVVKGEGEVTFGISSDLTKDALGECNTDSKKVPIVPGLYEVRRPGNAKHVREIRDIDPEAAKKIFRERAPSNSNNSKPTLPKTGLEVTVLPVLDPKIRMLLGNKTEETVVGLLELAGVAFQHSSLDIKFNLKYKKPVLYNKNLTASAKGYTSTVQSHNGPRFDYTAVSKDVNVILFFTYTFPEDVGLDFRISFSILGGVCRTPTEGVGIINYFATELANAEAVRRSLANVLGIEEDYIPVPNAIDPNPKFGPNGEKCTKVGGFMDIPIGANIWTACSNFNIKTVYRNNGLNCLPEVKCAEKDFHNMCPILAKSVNNGCQTKFMKESCPLSCDIPICSAPVLANAKLPDTYKCESVQVCKDNLSFLCREDRCNVPDGKGNGKFKYLCKNTCKLC